VGQLPLLHPPGYASVLQQLSTINVETISVNHIFGMPWINIIFGWFTILVEYLGFLQNFKNPRFVQNFPASCCNHCNFSGYSLFQQKQNKKTTKHLHFTVHQIVSK